jgi:hypothetical protein
MSEALDWVAMAVCGECRAELHYCVVHDGYYCPACDVWADRRCFDPDCATCRGRPKAPSLCTHPEKHIAVGAISN